MREQVQVIRVVAGLVAILATAAPAWAHAKLVRADPKPGSTVQTAPRIVRAVFNEELNPKGSALTVADSRGKRVDDRKGGLDLNDLDRKSLVVRLMAIGPGRYTVRWTAVSADDANVAKGSFRFSVAAAMSEMPLPPLRVVSPTSGAVVSGRVIVVFETPADLSKMTMGSEMSGMSAMKKRVHLHFDLDRGVTMPAMKHITKVGPQRYSIDLGPANPGPHTIRAYWADNKTHKPIGAVQTVRVTVR